MVKPRTQAAILVLAHRVDLAVNGKEERVLLADSNFNGYVSWWPPSIDERNATAQYQP